ncbi:MAG: VIT1/CCC1 transporter family protein [Candidatus Limnocylindrales bacterium]
MTDAPPASPLGSPAELQTSLANLKLEQDAIVLYDRLAALERDPRRAEAFRTIAGTERRHAEIWSRRLRDAGADVPAAGPPRARIRFLLLVARLFGTRAVAELVQSLEGDEEEAYLDQGSPEVASIVADEREHAEIWRRLAGDAAAAATAPASEVAAIDAPPATAATTGAPSAEPALAEAWHRSGRSGTLRAAIFGVSDGLVSNLSLVMGFVGASAGNQLIVLAGVAGLLAGAFSMAAGEWISMQSQRELFERQIELEREELKVMPEQEELELASVYRRKGIPDADARRLAHRLMADPEIALDTKVREELGLDPDQLGSPWGAAASSFLAFTAGAFVPLIAFIVTSGRPALIGALVLSGAALFAVGAAVSLFTGRSLVFSGLRQVGIGAAAATVTYGVGAVIGVTIAS